MRKFLVVKSIPKDITWEKVDVNEGECLYVDKWEGFETLMYNNKAVCDLGSVTEREYTKETTN